MPSLAVTARHEVWPLRDAFTISRGTKSTATVVVVSVSDGQFTGHGEAVPYSRFDETVDGALAAIASVGPVTTRESLARVLMPGAARNAVDCALWDFEAKSSGVSAAKRAGIAALKPVTTAFTLSLDTPEAMARKAEAMPHLPLLKLKLGGGGDHVRMRAVRRARPDARLIVDANEAWTLELFEQLMAAAAETGVEVIEQPLPSGSDEALRDVFRAVPICADESVHTAADIPRLRGLYDAINIKLDKAGGLTGALTLHRAARAAGMKIMIGSMVGTSLAVAPAMLLAQDAEWVDLDGPLLLARDRPHAISITNGVMTPPVPELWG
jgi:L-alanine-DL-glutamate epimerase-like enolase superfamily enzyme